MIRAYDILGCLGVSMLLCGLVSLPIGVIMSSQYIWNMGLGGIVAGLVVMCLALVIECPPVDWKVSRRWKMILPGQYIIALATTLFVVHVLFVKHEQPGWLLYATLIIAILSATFDTIVAAIDQDELTRREVEAMILKIENRNHAE